MSSPFCRGPFRVQVADIIFVSAAAVFVARELLSLLIRDPSVNGKGEKN